MSYMKIISRAVPLFIFALFAEMTFAHGGATGIVKERMDAMADMSDSMESLTAFMRGKVDYNATRVSELASSINEHAGSHLLELFPEGTDGGVSEAKPSIWRQWGQFETYANELSIISEALINAAANTSENIDSEPNMGMGMMNTMGLDMMGGQSSESMSVEMLSEMPATAVFRMLSQNCTACHTRFRQESEMGK